MIDACSYVDASRHMLQEKYSKKILTTNTPLLARVSEDWGSLREASYGVFCCCSLLAYTLLWVECSFNTDPSVANGQMHLCWAHGKNVLVCFSLACGITRWRRRDTKERGNLLTRLRFVAGVSLGVGKSPCFFRIWIRADEAPGAGISHDKGVVTSDDNHGTEC